MTDQISRQIHIEASPEDVWQALVDARKFGEWFHVDLDGPFEVGATTTGTMTYPGQEGVPWLTVTEALEPHRRFVFKWPYVPEVRQITPDTRWLTVEFVLEPDATGTLVTVTESGFASLPDGPRTEMPRDNSKGWEIQTGNLKDYVER